MRQIHKVSALVLSVFIATFVFGFSQFAHAETGVTTQESQGTWVKTDAVITDIQRKSGRKSTGTAVASVTYNIAADQEITSSVEIVKIPFYGTLNDIGDTITISYSSENPAIAYTTIGKIISQYGMYLLILLGIIVSVPTILSTIRKKT